MKLSFPGYSRTEVLTNFPMPVVLGPQLSTNGFAYNQVASSNGWDLLFLNANGTEELNYEIESWDAQGKSYVWVQLPQLTTNTWIWACWGDTNRASSPAAYLTNGAVWANDYAGVWHLANGVAVSGTDSTGNRNHGTIHNSAATTGVIDGAATFDGVSTYVEVGAPTSLMTNQKSTLSAWVYPVAGTVLLMKGNDNTKDSYGLEWIGNTSYLFTFGNTTDWLSDGGATPANQWSYVTAIIDGMNKYLYVNGLLKASNTFAGTLSTSGLPLWFGGQDRPSFNYWFNGTLDEARISPVARSANWVWAEWMSSASNAVFASYGPVLANPAPPFQVTRTAILPDNQLALSWQSVNGRVYTVEAATNLLPVISWIPVAANLNGTGEVTSWTGLVHQAMQFLRVKAQ
jgi:hypothetical protein